VARATRAVRASEPVPDGRRQPAGPDQRLPDL